MKILGEKDEMKFLYLKIQTLNTDLIPEQC